MENEATDVLDDIEKKISRFKKLPKWLRIVIIVLSIMTLLYWLGWLTYHFLKYFRVVMEWVFEERNYWTFIVCIIILLVGSLIMAQFVFDLNPIGKFFGNIAEGWQEFRNWLGELISV